MKKTTKFFILALFMVMFTLSLPAEKKEVNVIGAVGGASSDLTGVCSDLGVEFQFANKFYAQFLFDYYYNPGGLDIDIGFFDLDSSAYGFNLYGVFKHPVNEKLKLFLKAGGHYTTVKISSTFFGSTESTSEGDFGLGFGGGVEYFFGNKMGLIVGTETKFLFSEDTEFTESIGTWFKFSIGLIFRI